MRLALVAGAALGLFCIASARGASVTVFSTDFNSAIPSQFSGSANSREGGQGYDTFAGTPFSGDFLRNSSFPIVKTTLTLSGLASHTSVSLDFLLAIIDSWDGNGSSHGPDYFKVAVDNTLVFSHVFAIASGTGDYTPPAGVLLHSGTNLGFSSWADNAYDMGLDPTFQNIAHTASTLKVDFYAGGPNWQGGTDESWAIDNVSVTLNGVSVAQAVSAVPAPAAAWAGLTLLGGLVAGRIVRRRKA